MFQTANMLADETPNTQLIEQMILQTVTQTEAPQIGVIDANRC
jgi:hypothetical protein